MLKYFHGMVGDSNEKYLVYDTFKVSHSGDKTVFLASGTHELGLALECQIVSTSQLSWVLKFLHFKCRPCFPDLIADAVKRWEQVMGDNMGVRQGEDSAVETFVRYQLPLDTCMVLYTSTQPSTVEDLCSVPLVTYQLHTNKSSTRICRQWGEERTHKHQQGTFICQARGPQLESSRMLRGQ